ncbi:MAG: malate dehydrogenase [Candidatus Margulisbacteria bacterium]|nr:malate dehydrogenase [Candidatus Margulisiibacteriota bacterium]
MKKISIIGAGQVGATAALYCLQKNLGNVFLLDIDEGIAKGKALDLLQTRPILEFEPTIIGTSDYKDTKDSDLYIVTAGLARKPGMDRLDLLKKNAEIISGIAENIKKYSPKSIVIVVSNPVDVMTYLMWKKTGFDSTKVIGQAGVLDSARMAAFIMLEDATLKIPEVNTVVLGGHGDTMVPLRELTTIDGTSISKMLKPEILEQIIKRTQNGGAEIVNLLKTGSAYYAPAAATVKMAESILLDKKYILPSSVLPKGKYGLEGIYIGLPTELGKNGVQEIIELDISEQEKDALKKSADIYQKSIKELNI